VSANYAATPGLETEMVVIPAGSYLMGCDRGADNERPVRRVWVDSFAIGRFTVTNRQFKEFLNSARLPPGACESHNLAQEKNALEACSRWEQFGHPGQPVTSVNWFDAKAYCDWLAKQTGKKYRLPTEAEWERAARGGLEGKLYTWGDDPPQLQPGYGELWRNGPEPVGRRPANGFGLFDISENVHEWCEDWYAADYYGSAPEINPRGPASGFRRSSRGGSWRHQIKIARVAARSSIPPHFRYSDYGFRCACDA
jgi:formylglycine-generating enzyme required for sulfatase activity